MSVAGIASLAEGINPLWISRARARLRRRHVASWGAVTLTIATFVFVMIYRNVTEHQLGTPATAARSTLPALVIIQAVLLMFVGTGAVASAVSQDRDHGLLDYQRMTPMSPGATIVGYLFGLPVREYFLFALTLPLVGLAAWISDFPLLTLVHFYAVLFTSVWVYHMTAMAAGLVAPRARLASSFALGMVVALYFVLPTLSQVGITYFEYLTIRPTFFGLIERELPEGARDVGPLRGISPFRDVPFFGGTVHPTVYTLMVQASLIAALYAVVHRKWRDQNAHVLSKSQAIALHAGVAFFVLASLWPMITSPSVYDAVFGRFAWSRRAVPASALLVLSLVSLAICGVVALVALTATCPSRFRALEALRRARRAGRSRPGFDSDGASALPVAVAIIVITWALLGTILWLGSATGRFFSRSPTLLDAAPPAAIIALCVLFFQGFKERFGGRAVAVSLFLLWLVPFFAMTILWSADEELLLGTVVGLPCPAVAGWLVTAGMFEGIPAAGGRPLEALPAELRGHLPRLVTAAVVWHGALAVWAQWQAWTCRRRLRGIAAAPPADRAAGSGA